MLMPPQLKLIQEKYNTIMKPAIVKLERLIQHTSVDPSTPHEVWFQKTFNESLNNALQSFKAPQDPVDPSAAFAPFITLLKELVRQARPSTLELHEISPKLAKIDSSSILMPGVQDYVQSDEPVTINSFSPNVVVLPTKTRPRKLVLVGSDGRQYPYLLKGREDLHLDERMMQFLTVVNMLLKKDKQTAARGLRARNYAVIPLSDMSGLIQWVEGTAPLYQVYTQFVKRNNAYNSVVAAAQNQDKDQAPKPEPNKNIRPIDMFYAKIIPALKAKGIKSMSRHDWPLDIQKKVFLELEKETPRDLLEKELWCASESTGEWWKKVQAYSRSAAVMSMVGYIIGLGDRHLDNILIDYKTGEVVHIDYNVCFEKGLKLRVPEIVPFRMTQNMQRALGITGVEGSFRTACEQSLRVLRRNKETLLTLLEAFVYDPLVDWTTNKAAFEEKMMELSVTLSLFCSRVDEMKTVTKDAHDNFASRFPSLVGALASMENTRKKLIDMKKNTSEKHQKLGTVKESLSKTIAALSKSTTFDGRIVKEKQLAEERDNMEKKIAATVKQLASTREAHFRSLALLKEPLALINEVKLSLTVPRTLAQVSSIDLPMREDILRRCGEVDLEMSRLITHREMLAVQCIELMNTYKSITSQLPTSYLGNTSLREWETLLNLLLAEPTPETMLKIEQYMDEASWKQAADRDRAIEKHLFQQVTALSQKWVNASSLVTPTIAKAEKFDLQTKQLRDQLLMMTSSINAQSGCKLNSLRYIPLANNFRSYQCQPLRSVALPDAPRRRVRKSEWNSVA
jgi:PI-3-kinase-related kinase SMG-1